MKYSYYFQLNNPTWYNSNEYCASIKIHILLVSHYILYIIISCRGGNYKILRTVLQTSAKKIRHVRQLFLLVTFPLGR